MLVFSCRRYFWKLSLCAFTLSKGRFVGQPFQDLMVLYSGLDSNFAVLCAGMVSFFAIACLVFTVDKWRL